MTLFLVNILIKSIGVYFKAGSIYLSAELLDSIEIDGEKYEQVGSKISILVPKSEDNLRKVSNLLTSNWKLAIVEVNLETRAKVDDKFGKQTFRYNSNCLEIPEVCEPLIVKS